MLQALDRARSRSAGPPRFECGGGWRQMPRRQKGDSHAPRCRLGLHACSISLPVLQQYCLARCSAGNGCPGRAAATDLLLQVLHELLAVDGGALGAGALRLHHEPPLGADRLRGGGRGGKPARSPARLHQHLGNVWALAAPCRLDLPLTGCCCSRAAPFRLLRCWTRAAVGARRALQAMAVCILPVTVRVVGEAGEDGGQRPGGRLCSCSRVPAQKIEGKSANG